ncbi:MAG TPA: 4-hydroxybenzoate octaprenyltransferase [Caulobacteraceae bacterium]|jgi:4-hydroxybenzoate polyprenyltransferase
MSTVLPDAAPTNWVDRLAPKGLRPWLKLGRFDRPTGIWLLMLPGWQGIALADALDHRPPDLRLLLLFFLGAVLMRSAGCAYNDIVDRDIDAKVARTAGRPVASGQISVRAAWACVIVCSLASLLILLSLNLVSIALGVASLALVAAYPFMKRITWWPQAWLGLTFNWGILLGFTAVAGGAVDEVFVDFRKFKVEFGGDLDLAPALLLYLSAVFWTLGYDTIYAVQDIEDDALAGVKSSARRLGSAAPRAVAGFYLAAIALAGVSAWMANLSWPFWLIAPVWAALLLRQPLRLKLDDPAGALALFQTNAFSAFVLFAVIAAGALRLNFSHL